MSGPSTEPSTEPGTGPTTAAAGVAAETGRGLSSPAQQISLVDLLDRLLGTGVVLAGDITISLAGVDLVQVRLHALISSVRADMTEWR